ncbi:hypothetical protein AB434_0322 [Heyndrickxia coagulans]|nr:hypothetical protein AB434_0322 [Heyndrickxia coagulans]
MPAFRDHFTPIKRDRNDFWHPGYARVDERFSKQIRGGACQ